MWALIAGTHSYPEKIYLYSEDRASLEEIALSLYEEDAYEWFCIYNNTDYYKDKAIQKAYEQALFYNQSLEIVRLGKVD